MMPWPRTAALPRVSVLMLELLLVGICATPRSAGGMAVGVDCREPFVFPRADANVVFLPFGYTPQGFARAQLGDGARDLARVLQLDAMIAFSSIGNIASIQLDGDGADELCGPEPVFDELTGASPGAEPPLYPGQGLVEVWGLVTEDEGEVSIQTFLKFARRDRSEDLKVTIDHHDFVLSPSDQFVAFSPRSMSTEDLAAIRRARAESAVLYPKPDTTSSGIQVSSLASSRTSVSYQIEEVRPPWLHVIAITHGSFREGWIFVPPQPGRLLSGLMPELHLIRLIAAYLRDRVQADAGRAPSPFLLKVAETSLASFEKQVHGDEDTGALAIGQQLLGMMHDRRAAQSTPLALQRAGDLFDRAARRLPANAIAQSNSAVATLQRQTGAGGSVAPDIERRLERSVALDPSDAKRLDNLESFYRRLPGAATDVRMQNVQRIRARTPFAPVVPAPRPRMQIQLEPSPGAPTLPDLGHLDINQASREQLLAIPGVTPELAGRIITGRPYRSWDEVARRLNVPPRSLAKMKDALRLESP